MKNIMYDMEPDLDEIIKMAKGRNDGRICVLIFILSFILLPEVPFDVLFKNVDLLFRFISSSGIAIVGTSLHKVFTKKMSRKKLEDVSMSLEKNNVYVEVKDLINSVMTDDIVKDEHNPDLTELINYFYVLDRDNQLRVLEFIRTNLVLGSDEFQCSSLYLLDEEEMKNIEIPAGEIAKLKIKKKREL